jgi:hypothetical protein
MFRAEVGGKTSPKFETKQSKSNSFSPIAPIIPLSLVAPAPFNHTLLRRSVRYHMTEFATFHKDSYDNQIRRFEWFVK